MNRPREPKPSGIDSSNAVHRPSKSLGQNFLVDQRVIKRIIDALRPVPGETIIEIGPGRGALTESLVESHVRLVAIEFDRNLIPVLCEKFAANSNFVLVPGDALNVDYCALIEPAYHARVIGNLPYNVGTAIVQRLLQERRCVSEMILMLQKEVVDRMTASPGSKDRGYLSVVVEAYSTAERLFDVAPGSFRPAPKIWSTVVRILPKQDLGASIKDEKLFWQLVSAGFSQRRKTILNNLRTAPSPLQETIKAYGGASIVLCQAEVGLQRRAETLSLEEWVQIAKVLANAIR
jgi:16S rRNA (adenine1518-N6/adenine1519-N6)-dimethyltransferase